MGVQTHGSHIQHKVDLIDNDFLTNDGCRLSIGRDVILKAQKEDLSIGKVRSFKLEGCRPSIQDAKNELPYIVQEEKGGGGIVTREENL